MPQGTEYFSISENAKVQRRVILVSKQSSLGHCFPALAVTSFVNFEHHLCSFFLQECCLIETHGQKEDTVIVVVRGLDPLSQVVLVLVQVVPRLGDVRFGSKRFVSHAEIAIILHGFADHLPFLVEVPGF